MHIVLPSWPGLSPQVEFTRLAALNRADLGQARGPMPSTPLTVLAIKTWMPATSAGMTTSKFTHRTPTLVAP